MNIFILVLLGIIINDSCSGQLSSNFSRLSKTEFSDVSHSKTEFSDALHSPEGRTFSSAALLLDGKSSNVDGNYRARTLSRYQNSSATNQFVSANSRNKNGLIGSVPEQEHEVRAKSGVSSQQVFNTGINIRCACDTPSNSKYDVNSPVGNSSKRLGSKGVRAFWNRRLLPLWCYKKIVGIVGYPPTQNPFFRINRQ